MADEPQLHPDAPAVPKEQPQGYVPPPPDPQGDLEAVAALIGTTAARSAELAETVVGEGTGTSKQSFDAHTVLKQHMVNTGQLNQPLQQQAVQQGIQPPAPGIQPPIPQPVMQQSTPAVYDDGQVLRRLLAIEDKLNNLEVVFEKILKGVLRKNAKQLTIRFNDSEDQKSK